MKIQKTIIAVAAILLGIIILSGCSSKVEDQKIPVRVLILPKFEEMEKDFPGEAQYFYEEYLDDGEVYEIDGYPEKISFITKTALQCALLARERSERH